MTERKASLQTLLYDIYDGYNARHYSFETESWTDTSLFSDINNRSIGDWSRFNPENLKQLSISELSHVVYKLRQEVTENSQRLVRQLKRRDKLLNRVQGKCNMVTAVLQALSPKRSVDTKLQFNLEPPDTESGYDQWLNAMRAVARLPDGIPHHFRKKLWLTLAQHHIQNREIDWASTCHLAFNERMNPDDDKLGMQIIKDLHRTGWSGLSAEQERILLKRVLLAYARFNKTIGYCQGFNVIAALVLEVTEYREEVALKMMIFLIEQVLPCGYFDQTLRALSVDMAVLRDLLHQRLPKMAAHLDYLQQNSESEYEPPLTNVFTMQWFLTLFATSLPKSAVFRVWDSLMLEGSEVLLRTALAIWAKIAKRVCRTKSADEFYGLMGVLCHELLQMTPTESNDLMQLIYNMAEFPYPGLAELRERYTWNIQPFSSTFKLLRQQVTSILNSDSEDSSDNEKDQNCIAGFLPGEKACGSNRGSAVDLNSLQKQYKLMKQRQKQAAIILQNAYEKGQRRIAMNSMRMRPAFSPTQPEAFNHLYVRNSAPTGTFTTLNGTVPVSSKVVQPSGKARINQKPDHIKKPVSRTVSNASRASSNTLQGSWSPGSLTPTGPRSPNSDTEFWGKRPSLTSEESLIFGLRRSRSLDLNENFSLEPLYPLRRTKSCIELKFRAPKFMTSSPKKSYKGQQMPPLVSPRSDPWNPNTVIRHAPLGMNGAHSIVSRKSSGKKKAQNPMMNKSRAILNSFGVDEKPKPVFNPFPTRHRSALIEREKKFGLY